MTRLLAVVTVLSAIAQFVPTAHAQFTADKIYNSASGGRTEPTNIVGDTREEVWNKIYMQDPKWDPSSGGLDQGYSYDVHEVGSAGGSMPGGSWVWPKHPDRPLFPTKSPNNDPPGSKGVPGSGGGPKPSLTPTIPSSGAPSGSLPAPPTSAPTSLPSTGDVTIRPGAVLTKPGSADRLVVDESSPKTVSSPKGVAMRIGIDRGTLQRVETPKDLVADIRGSNK